MDKFDKIIADIVREDYRTAEVFKKYGFNYCCGGQVFLRDACEAKKLDYEVIARELHESTKDVFVPNFLPFNNWNIEFLIDYILNIHHAYLATAIPSIKTSLNSFVLSHASKYPELVKVEELFDELAKLAAINSLHEEDVIFPYIKQIEVTHRRKETYGSLFVRTLRKPLSNLEHDHYTIIELLTKLRTITNNYAIVENACTNHRVIYLKLKEFDNDFVQHKHLENNILFPRAIALEKELLDLYIA